MDAVPDCTVLRSAGSLTGVVVTAWSRAIPVTSMFRERNDAYTVLRDFAAIFRGMTCWNGEQIVVQADMPRDVDFTHTRANIIGKPRYSSSSSQVRYTNALVSWSDPDNAYADAMEPAFIPELVSRYSFNQLELTARLAVRARAKPTVRGCGAY